MKKAKLKCRLAWAEATIERLLERDALRDEEWMRALTDMNHGTRPPKPMLATDFLGSRGLAVRSVKLRTRTGWEVSSLVGEPADGVWRVSTSAGLPEGEVHRLLIDGQVYTARRDAP